ncbi:MAG: HAMP domain-containing protein [Chloroflexi bacterium]|nr:MAG: HAMP domain-containing protein [Chloroflexota bacterium]
MPGHIGARIGATSAVLLAVIFVAVLTLPLAVALAVSLFVAAIGTLVLRASILGPIRIVTDVARRTAKGTPHQRIASRPPGEMGELTDAVNEMVQNQDRHIAAASADHNRMLAALNSSADAVIALNQEGIVAFVNASAGRLLSQRKGDLIGKPFAWILPDVQVIEALHSTSRDQDPQILVTERPNKRFLQVIVTPIVDGGEWTSLIVLHDVTEVRRVEQVRRDFVANVSHELRTPLAALNSVIETLRAGAIEDRLTASDFLSRADGELQRLVVIVEELLQLSRIESGELALAFDDVEVDELISSAVDRLRPAVDRQGLTITTHVAPTTPRLKADRELLERALVNLIQNSVKYTPRGGSIEVLARVDDGVVTLAVHDTGEGIDAVDLPRVFERFYKTDRARRAGGTGLGLAIVKHTAEAHGGSVQAESELGRGSTFSLSIPLTTA